MIRLRDSTSLFFRERNQSEKLSPQQLVVGWSSSTHCGYLITTRTSVIHIASLHYYCLPSQRKKKGQTQTSEVKCDRSLSFFQGGSFPSFFLSGDTLARGRKEGRKEAQKEREGEDGGTSTVVDSFRPQPFSLFPSFPPLGVQERESVSASNRQCLLREEGTHAFYLGAKKRERRKKKRYEYTRGIEIPFPAAEERKHGWLDSRSYNYCPASTERAMLSERAELIKQRVYLCKPRHYIPEWRPYVQDAAAGGVHKCTLLLRERESYVHY